MLRRLVIVGQLVLRLVAAHQELAGGDGDPVEGDGPAAAHPLEQRGTRLVDVAEFQGLNSSLPE